MAQSVPRTATFAWSKSTTRGSPLLATGTVSGALDESFSSSGALELWDPFAEESKDGKGGENVKGRVDVNARFNRLAWSKPSDGRPEGVIAAGMENGELGLWDPAKILAGQGEEASIFSTDRHKGTVRGLAWNTLQPSLFASGATDAEIFIWDTKNLSKPYGPSANKSRHLTDITALSWNPSVAHILATSSASGSTVIWDLKGRQEVIHLSYLGGQGSVYSQGPKPVSSVCWHPERGTRVITASEDDSAPVILVWDLRNYRTPERILSGHEKGVLSLDWCSQDPELLFSCGKDCRTLAWNPSTGEMVGELPATTNWSFDVAACPRNPSYVATASFDGKINVTSLQNTSASSEPAATQQTQPENAADIFSAGNLSNLAAQVHPGVSLKQPPRWLRRPASSSFGFGGKLATVSSLAAPPAQPGAPAQSAPAASRVSVHQVVTESDIVERALRLDNASDSRALAEFCDAKKSQVNGDAASSSATKEDLENWKLLSSLFRADSKDELVSLLGFSKEDVRKNVEEAIKSFKASSGNPGELPLGHGNRKPASSENADADDDGSIAREPLVTFADQASSTNDAMSGSSEGEGAAARQGTSVAGATSDATPSETEASVSAVSDATTKIGGAESEFTEPSLFGDDATPGNPQQQAAADFYSQLAPGTPSGARAPPSLSERFNLTQHHIDRAGSSIAATIGSRPSSAASDSLKPTTFRIYPQDESEADRLLTRSLVLGDFESAVSLCLSADRFADALLLAVRGGADLLAKTQKAYFERRTTALPYLRLFQSIISDDLTDVVQNADLGDWQEIFVVLCTFAKPDEFAALVEQLGQRLEYQFAVARQSSGGGGAAALEQRRSAVLCYLAAGKLERVVNIWIEEMKEEEKAVEEQLGGSSSAGAVSSSSAVYAAHAQALQSFIEKVTVFISAVAYVDSDLAQPTTSNAVAETGARSYKLAPLYDKYHEYAELLAAQGLVTLAVKYAALTPADYVATGDGVSTRERLQVSSGKRIAAPSVAQQLQQAAASKAPYQPAAPVQPTSNYYSAPTAYTPMQPQQQMPPQSGYNDPYMPTQTQQQPQQSGQPSYNQQSNPYAPANTYAPVSNGYQPQPDNTYNPASFVPQPPAPITSAPSFANHQQQQAAPLPPPPAKKAPVGGWNDAPVLAPKRTGSAAGSRPAVAPILSPFANAGPPTPGAYGQAPGPGQGSFPFSGQGQAGQGFPPPPPSRGANKTPAQQFVQPPPPAGSRGPNPNMPPQNQQQPQQQRPPQTQQGFMHSQQQGMPQQGMGMNRPPPLQQQSMQNMPPHMRMQSPAQGQGQMPPHLQQQQQQQQQQQRFGPPQQQQGQPTQQPQGQGQYGPAPGQGGQYHQQGPPQPQQQHQQPQQNFVPPPPARRG